MKTGLRRRGERGNSAVEMGLILVPLLFLIFSTFDVARAMWTYHTVSAAVKRGTRYAAVHGARCAEASAACQSTVRDVVAIIRQAGFGLDPAKLQLTLMAGSQTYTCTTASSCSGDTTVWPSDPDNAVGQQVTIDGTYTFNPVLSLMWPGQAFGQVGLSARATEMIQF